MNQLFGMNYKKSTLKKTGRTKGNCKEKKDVTFDPSVCEMQCFDHEINKLAVLREKSLG